MSQEILVISFLVIDKQQLDLQLGFHLYSRSEQSLSFVALHPAAVSEMGRYQSPRDIKLRCKKETHFSCKNRRNADKSMFRWYDGFLPVGFFSSQLRYIKFPL